MSTRRNYKIKFRISIGDNEYKKSSNFLKHYMPRWTNFMRLIISRKLAFLPTDKTASVKELPLLRTIPNDQIKTENIIEFLDKKDPDLSRMLLDVTPLFDVSPNDLKVHILAVFGVTYAELKEYLETS